MEEINELHSIPPLVYKKREMLFNTSLSNIINLNQPSITNTPNKVPLTSAR